MKQCLIDGVEGCEVGHRAKNNHGKYYIVGCSKIQGQHFRSQASFTLQGMSRVVTQVTLKMGQRALREDLPDCK